MNDQSGYQVTGAGARLYECFAEIEPAGSKECLMPLPCVT